MRVDLAAEMRASLAALKWDKHAETLGMLDLDLMQRSAHVGLARIILDGDLYVPDWYGESAWAFITPVVRYPDGAIERRRSAAGTIDLVAWHPATPQRWALRTGLGESLGLIPPQYLDPEPVRVWRTPLAWLRAGLHGICLLTAEPAAIARILGLVGGDIIAEDRDHAATLRRACERPYPAPKIIAA